MDSLVQMFLYFFLIVSLGLCSDCNERPRIKVRQGEIEGTELTSFSGNKFFAFRGIPFAKPPVGALRFKLPEPADPWDGVLDASEDSPVCPQFGFFVHKYVGQEDCLYLNVYTRKLPSADYPVKLPVLFYIHGGGFFMGTATTSFSGPFRLMDKDVVFVTVNYRLGPLGFLNTEDNASPGNFGLWDQRLALQWVQENIRAFGGNPDQVTIYGVSAGGASVSYHLISPASAGLFHRAIIQSGTALCNWAFQNEPLKAARRLAEDVGCPISSTEKLVECLRQKDSEEIINVTPKYFKISIFPMVFVPSVERCEGPKFLEDHPLNLINNGRFNHVPVISGITNNEGLSFALEELKILEGLEGEALRKRLEHTISVIGGIEIKDVDEVLELYFKSMDLSNVRNPDFSAVFSKILSDSTFNACNEQLVVSLSQHNIPVYTYITEHKQKLSFIKQMYGDHVKGVGHGEDATFVLNFNFTNFIEDITDLEADDKVMSEKIKSMWVNFAKFGNPTPKEGENVGVVWKTVSPGDINYLRIRLPLEMNRLPLSEKLNFWNKKVIRNKVKDEL